MRLQNRGRITAAVLILVAASGVSEVTELPSVLMESADGAARAETPGDFRPMTLRAPSHLPEALRPDDLSDFGERSERRRVKTETILLAESFEDSWPVAPWRVDIPEQAARVVWGRSAYRASDGSHSIWCAQSGDDSPGTGGPAPANTASWTIVGPFDLTEATSGTLSFDLWLHTELFQDYFMWLASTDGNTFSGTATSTSTSGWKAMEVDLSNWGELGNLTGQPLVWIAFVYRSDHDVELEGAYVDNVRLVADSGSDVVEGFTYTTAEDFELGQMVGVETDDDDLQLSSVWSALPYLWVVNSVTGTVSKLDTATGDELARYRTGPVRDLDPSPVAVDLDGSCWVGNRGAGTVLKIGLVEMGGCVDRDNNGVVDTSTDVDADGNIGDDELLAWGEDECVLYEIVLVDGAEGVHVPGESHEDYARNHLRALAVNAENDVWAGVHDSQTFYRLDGSSGEIVETIDLSEAESHPYAAVVDAAGILWSSSWPDPWVTRIDQATAEVENLELSHGSMGLALDGDDHLFVTGFDPGLMSRIDLELGEVATPTTVDWQASGVTSIEDGDVWVAAVGSETVSRYSSDGILRASLPISNGPTTVAADAAGKVWVLGAWTGVLVRIEPLLNRIDGEKEIVSSSSHDATGDATGIVARNLTTHFGTWTVVYDSQYAQTPWGMISWNGSEPAGSSLEVRVRSSHDQALWSHWEQASSGDDLTDTPAGRFLQIEAAFQDRGTETPPVLDDLTVMPAVVLDPLEADFDWSPVAPVAGQAVSFNDTSGGIPTSWSWDFGDGSSSLEQNPSHVFATAGSYSVSLEVSDGSATDSRSQDVVVAESLSCAIECTLSVSAEAEVGQTVPFTVTADVSNCEGDVAYSWSFGDGASSSEQSPSHSYSMDGSYQWVFEATVEDQSCSGSGTITIAGGGPEVCTHGYWVAAVTHDEGAFGSSWRSDLGLLNPGAEAEVVELRFYAASSDPTIRTVSVAAGSMIDIVDVVDWIFPGLWGSAAFQVCSDAELVVTSRTYNQLAGDHQCSPAGTFGQRLDGFESGSGLNAGESAHLLQLRENDAFRTNLGFTNTGPDATEVLVHLFDEIGTELVTYTVPLVHGHWWQDNRPFANRADRTDLDAAWARVEVTAGSGIFVYASVIDNVTNDATTVMAR